MELRFFDQFRKRRNRLQVTNLGGGGFQERGSVIVDLAEDGKNVGWDEARFVVAAARLGSRKSHRLYFSVFALLS